MKRKLFRVDYTITEYKTDTVWAEDEDEAEAKQIIQDYAPSDNVKAEPVKKEDGIYDYYDVEEAINPEDASQED